MMTPDPDAFPGTPDIGLDKRSFGGESAGQSLHQGSKEAGFGAELIEKLEHLLARYSHELIGCQAGLPQRLTGNFRGFKRQKRRDHIFPRVEHPQ